MTTIGPGSSGDRLTRPIAVLVLAACGLSYFGQTFAAWAWPALDGYPAIERWIDPKFLTTDFYTNTTGVYGVDTWQGFLFGGLETLTGIPYALTIAVLTALRVLFFPAVLYLFFKALTGDRLTALLGVTLGTLAIFNLPATLGWGWLWGDGSPAMFAAFAATASWVLLLYRRVWQALLLMAVAAVAQPLVAVHSGIFFALVFFLDFDGKERIKALISLPNIAAGLIFASTFASQYVSLSPHAGETLPTAEYVDILVWERHPTDFLPSRFETDLIIAAALGAAALILMLVKVWGDLPRRRLMVGTLAAYAAICILGSIFVELIPVRLVADLIPYRTVVISAPIMLAIIGSFAARAYRNADILILAVLGAAFLGAGAAAQKLSLSPVIPAAILLAAAVLGLLPQVRLGFAPPILRLFWPAVILALLVVGLVTGYARRQMMITPTLANAHPVYAWAAKSTAPDASFLVEQFPLDYGAIRVLSPQHMRLIGRRPVAASMDYPFADRDLRAWRKTWIDGLNHGAPGFVETADAATLKAICAKLPYDYVVRARPLEGMAPVAAFPPSHGLGEVNVYRPCAMAR